MRGNGTVLGIDPLSLAIAVTLLVEVSMIAFAVNRNYEKCTARLERYQSGELDAEQMAFVRECLMHSATLSKCLIRLEEWDRRGGRWP